MRHRHEQRNHGRFVSAVRSSSRCKGASSLSIQFPLKPQATETIYERFQLRRSITETSRSSEDDPVGPLDVGVRWDSVLGDHLLASILPTGNFSHYRWRNDLGHSPQ